ncbi:hypothetical protein HK096_004813, partial [Nowakowskiella sp. JEL0078]
MYGTADAVVEPGVVEFYADWLSKQKIVRTRTQRRELKEDATYLNVRLHKFVGANHLGLLDMYPDLYREVLKGVYFGAAFEDARVNRNVAAKNS